MATYTVVENVNDTMVPFGISTLAFFKSPLIFAPAMKPVHAGANISGDLKNPSVDIPKGTIVAVSVTTTVYVLMCMFFGAIASRCYLINDYLSSAKASVNEWVLIIGIFCSTSMAALTSLSSAPRLMQAVAKDGLIPILNVFAKVNDSGDPVNGYMLTLFVAFACNCVGGLNAIAPLITDFSLIAYMMVNWSCFMLCISKTPGWRPSFRYYNQYTCLFGAVLCLFLMVLIDWVSALMTFFIGSALFRYILFKDPGVLWDLLVSVSLSLCVLDIQ